MSGQTAYLKLRDGNTIEVLYCEDPLNGICGGLKMANGTNPMGDPAVFRHPCEIGGAGSAIVHQSQRVSEKNC
ncbi:MAG: hypothetical protein R3C26_09470 [Calditrichia bacterium]